MQKGQVRNSLMLLLTAIIWGVSFVAQSKGMDYVGPFTFNAVRCIIGGISLLPVILIMNAVKKKTPVTAEPTAVDKKAAQKTLIIGGILCGVLLCFASNMQQIGIQYTTVGKAGFITACYIIFVPLFGLFLKRNPGPLIWGAVVLALVGLYLLCITEGFSINKGDVYILICSLLFTFHILVIDHFSPKVDGVKMSCIQFFVCGILSGVLMLIFETPQIGQILEAWLPILYSGILSCGVAYTLQIVGQKGLNPALASLILSLESCVSVLAGWVLLNQRLTVREIIGCVIMFAAIILAQIPPKPKKQQAEVEG